MTASPAPSNEDENEVDLGEDDEAQDIDFDGDEVGDGDDAFDGDLGDDDDIADEFGEADGDDDEDEDDDASPDSDEFADSEADETEADLAAMLMARLGADDDDDDDEDEDDGGGAQAKTAKRSKAASSKSVVEEDDDFKVQPRQAAEWVCTSCFLIVSKAAASSTTCPHCGAERAS